MGGRGGSSGMVSSDINESEYQHFDDVPVEGETGGWRYDPRGEEHGEAQTDFFSNNSNFDALIREMTRDQMSAFRDYWTSGTFMRGQQYKGWDTMTNDEKKFTQIFDDYLDRATLSKGVVVTRLATAELVLGAGNRKGTKAALEAMKGQVVISKGNMSCGAAKQGLRISTEASSDKNVEYRIHIPSGTKGAGMWIGDHRINHWGTIQREFMTNRDARFKVGKTTYDKKRKVYMVDLTYAGHLDHDYGTSGRYVEPVYTYTRPSGRWRT